MKTPGKRLVRYLKLLKSWPEHEVGKRASLRRVFKAEHRKAVASGYIKSDVKYIEIDNEPHQGIHAKVFVLTTAGEDFLRQLRGDFTQEEEPFGYSSVNSPGGPTWPSGTMSSYVIG